MVSQKQFVTYQEIYDLQTQKDGVTAIAIHTPSGAIPSVMLEGFYKQYNKVRYIGCDMILNPSAKMSLDPLQFSQTSADDLMDMRDEQNPILTRGIRGEDLNTILDQIYQDGNETWAGDSATAHTLDFATMEKMYYQALTSPDWGKSPTNSVLRRNGLYPLVYDIATNYQMGKSMSNSSNRMPGDVERFKDSNDALVPAHMTGVSRGGTPTSGGLEMFSMGSKRMGWIDTHQRVVSIGNVTEEPVALIPKVYMYLIVLPPAYKIKQSFRMVLTHTFEFSDFRSISMMGNYADTPGYYNTIDMVTAKAVPMTADEPPLEDDSVTLASIGIR